VTEEGSKERVIRELGKNFKTAGGEEAEGKDSTSSSRGGRDLLDGD